MSAPKKPQEEGSHSAPLKRSLEETVFCGVSGKHAAPVNNDYHLPFELGSDGRMTKVQRTEPSDLDKRSPLLHWVSSSPSSYVEHSSTTGTRSELRNPKDARDVKIESREARSEIREFHSDLRMETPVGKAKLEVRLDNRANEKDLRSDRGSYTDFKSDGKLEKDSHAAASSHINWKESKEHHKGKRHESSLDNQEPWRVGRHGLPNTGEVVISRPEEWDSSEVHEAVGENKIDMKGEEKFREKDRKRKEEKHKDDKDRIDRRSMQLGEASIERKELPREEKETERWERERKDAQREKERDDKENNPIKRGSPNASEKENWHHGKEMLDGSVRSEQETVTLEQKKHKDDNWKADRELEDKKKEREAEMGDNHEQCGKSYDKEPEDGFIEGDGVAERDRDAFGNGYQHHRRMIRKRGTAQTPNRDPRFRTRARENEGSQVETEVSNVVYKAGECLQELLKSWQEFKASQEVNNDGTCQNYPTLEIRIPAEYVTSSNRQVKGAQLWGTEIYTNDSDLVAVLMHTGYCRPTSSPPAGIQELKATVRILPPQEYYASTLRNNVRSRAWGAGIGCSFRVEHCCIVKKDGGIIDLEPRLSHISALEPTLAPVFVERTMTTRSTASNALRQLRFVREVSIQYNLCNEPWVKYSISIVADKGLKKPLYTSARLKKGEVLYFETHSNRYELCYNGEKTSGTGSTSAEALGPEQEKRQNHNPQVQNGERNLAERENTVDVFRWSRCKKILPEEVMLSNGIPSRLEDLEVIEDNLEWEDLLWSQTGVLVGGKTYTLARVQFLAPKKK